MRAIGPKMQAHVPLEHVALIEKEAERIGAGVPDVVRDAIAFWAEHYASRVFWNGPDLVTGSGAEATRRVA